MTEPYRTALDAPEAALSLVDETTIERALAYSRQSPRRRVIQPFHKSASDPLHRMLNAMQPESYVRPHRHLDPPKAEAWIALRGALAFFTFEEDGRIRDCLRVSARGPVYGVDLVPGVYHGLVALEPDTLIYEVKTGPYAQLSDKAFAPFAPAEGSPEATRYLQALLEEHARRA